MAKKSDDRSQSFGDWVDRYTLRYGAGTIVGAVIVAFLYSKTKGSIPFKLESLSAAEAGVVFLVLGFAWCYIASAPIMAYHVSRSIFLRRGTLVRNWWGGGALVALVVGLLWACHNRFGLGWGGSLAVSGFATAWIGQMTLCVYVVFRRVSLFAWYDVLAKARTFRTDDFVESYKTMREHGNAFLVIVHELGLGIIAVAALQQPELEANFDKFLLILVLLIAVWIIPGVAMYFAALRLESDFVDATLASQPAVSVQPVAPAPVAPAPIAQASVTPTPVASQVPGSSSIGTPPNTPNQAGTSGPTPVQTVTIQVSPPPTLSVQWH